MLEDSLGVDFALICERAGETTIAFHQDVFERCLRGDVGYEPNLATSLARFPERLARSRRTTR